jgi:hypothetical protein
MCLKSRRYFTKMEKDPTRGWAASTLEPVSRRCTGQ